ncbi:MAG: CDP-glucose 4,6-dehydratase [Sandaracinaceae bacterium]
MIPSAFDVYRGRRVLVTGHTGFKGSWLTAWLHRLGAEVSGLALDPSTDPSLFVLARIGPDLRADMRIDLRDRARLAPAIEAMDPDFVFHLAAQPIVKTSYAEPLETFATNVMGTLHVLDALRALRRPASRPLVVVVVTTDKVYANDESGMAFRESDPLGGHDPYSASKACAEIATASFRASFAAGASLRIATARAGNVIGGGDWSAHRLFPDIVRALGVGAPIALRNPRSTRPWQHVLEPLAGYLMLGARLASEGWEPYATAWNFGPRASSVRDVQSVAEVAARAWGGGRVEVVEDPTKVPEAGTLALAIDRAEARLGWHPRWDLEESVHRTVTWYARVLAGSDARAELTAEIAAYEALLSR